jgi:hypothetical protein
MTMLEAEDDRHLRLTLQSCGANRQLIATLPIPRGLAAIWRQRQAALPD